MKFLTLHPETRAAINAAVRRTLTSLRQNIPMNGVQWADHNFYLSAESSLIKGGWKTLPWQIPILNAMTNDDIKGVYVQKSKRTGFTKMLLATIGYYVEHKARKVGLWQPSDGDAKEFSLVEVDTMIRDVPAVREKFPYFGKKSSRNTVTFKQFIGAPLYLKGGKSAKNFRRMTLDVALLDELSAFDPDIEHEGSALKLADGRTEGSPFKKLVAGSTPKITDQCQIEAAVNEADVKLHYHFPCPHCGHEQRLQWGGQDTDYGFKWVKDEPQTVRYQCADTACSALISQAEFAEQLTADKCRFMDTESGIWTRDGLEFFDAGGMVIDAPRHVGFYIWAGYSPLAQWWEIVDEWLKSCRDPLKTKTFVNTVLGETYDIASGDQADKGGLERRSEKSRYGYNPLPERVCYVTAGVDVQPDRFELQFLGWGIGAECWVLEYVVLPCDTSIDESWNDLLDQSLDRYYPHPSGKYLAVSFAGIDTGGTATQQSYRYCKANDHKGRLAMKGFSGENRPVIPLRPSKNWAHKGLKGWNVGVDTAKTMIYQRLAIEQQGQGYIHFPHEGLPEDYFKQLTAEKRRMKIDRSGRRTYYWWAPPGARVEALDTFVYALAAMEHSGVDLALAWQKLTRKEEEFDFAALGKAMGGE